MYSSGQVKFKVKSSQVNEGLTKRLTVNGPAAPRKDFVYGSKVK